MAEQQQQLIWLGAGSATEPALNFAQYSKTLLVEAREEACTALSQRFAEATIQVLPTLVANEAATLPFTRYSLTEFSAVTPITGLKSLFPGIKVKTQEDINAVAVTKVVEQAALTGDHNTLVIDIPDQAFTLVQALINSKQLTAFSTLYIPYGTTALYAEMPPFSALTELLAKHYFALHHTATTDPDLPLYIFKQDAAAKTVAQLKQQLAQTKAKESELITQLAQATTKQAELTKQLEQAKQHAETYKQQASTDKQQAAEALAQATAKQAELTKQLEQAKQHAETYKQQASTEKQQAAEALAQATAKQAELTKQLEQAKQHAETYKQQASTEKQQAAEALAQATAKQAELTKQLEQAKQHAETYTQQASTEKQQAAEALAQATAKQAELTKQLEQAKQQAETYTQQASTEKQQAAEALAQATAKQAELTKQLEQAKQHAETYKQQASTDKEQAAEALAQATTKQAELTKQLEHANQHAETYTQQASTEKQQLAEALAQATAKQAELTKQQEQAKQHAANEKQLAETEKQQSSEALAQAIAKQAELAKQLEHAQQQATEALAQATAKQAELTKQLEQAKQQAAVEKQQATETLALAVTKEAEQTKQYDLVKKLNAEVTEKLVQLQKSSDLSIGELKTELANTQQQLSQALDSLKLAENTMQLEELLDKKLEKLIETQNQDLTKAVGNIKNHINAKVDNSAKQIEAFIGINNYLDKGIKPLNFHGWPISPDIGLYITGLIDANNYDVIIEFGSGTSTVLMAKALKAKQQNYTQPLLEKTSKNNSLAVSGASFNDLPSRIVTFEHNSQYYEKTLEALRNNQVDELVDLVHAPLVDYRYKDGSEYLYYHCADKMAELAKIFKGRKANILVLVDGPPGATNKNARFPALPHLLNHLPEHAFVIIMDDYSRSEEKDTVEQWKQIATAKVLNPQIEVIPSEKGLAILSINR